MKKLHVVCAVALLALAAMVLIGCDQPTSNPGDTWTKVETVDGLKGVWKSSASATIIQEGEAFQTTMEMILTYPTVDGEVSIVQKFDGVLQPEETIPKDEFEQALKDGKVPSVVQEVGYMYINAAKTELKVEGTLKKVDFSEEDWNYIQAVVVEGDVELNDDTPDQVIVRQYFHKQK